MKLSGWGNHPVHETALIHPRSAGEAAAALAAGRAIARGNGRAYGDSAVGVATTLQMSRLDKMIAFDAAQGILIAEAGVTLVEIIDAFAHRGWFPSVTPGTKFVTLGGAIAADVHGKNHHVDGSFGNFLDWIDLLGPDGEVRRCSRDENAELFAWTVGGMGLTGVILRAAIRLRRIETVWIRQETVATAGLAETMAAFERSAEATYSVAWIDTLARGRALGRSILMLGEHASLADIAPTRRDALFKPPRRALAVPFMPPVSLVNGPVVRAFNFLYYQRMKRAPAHRLVSLDSFFYPLDGILGWNRIYGRKGFVQFQCVIPLAAAQAGLVALLTRVADAGAGSFLAVLKRLGPQAGRLSFPMEGYTLAMDFPAGRRTDRLVAALEAIVMDHGGRLYLAKDSKMTAAGFARLDPRGAAYAQWRRAAGLSEALQSRQSERLDL